MRRITIGQWPAMPVALARDRALAIKAAIARGDDPANEHKVPTFGALAALYMERHAKPHKRSWKEDEGRLKRIPWMNRRLSDVSQSDVLDLQARIRDERGPFASNHVIRLVRSMFNKASQWEIFDGRNPTLGVKLFRQISRERFLSPEEVRRLNEALVHEGRHHRAYFALALLLGPRRNELLAMRWKDLDFEQRTWRLPMTKAGRSHLLPLPAPAVDILQALPRATEFVFLGSSHGHMAPPNRAWHRIRHRAGLEDVHIHDLRRTLGSWRAASGYSLQLIGKALNHANIATTQIYARLQLDPVREALERNAILMQLK